ncbi:hypothetical protein AJ79_05702 [Helicocarpus griseus UAMH5409]|uniref:IMS import disulfide relay-system CHCH-CHCH-like Cx9C domain-containing protein n=1 Tax=Helicocarpus griseus UAMH5409 TaxID=1447875 RepID=A0A2B7XKD9_9EURO|nr:hypothetical protein AJ79_05702 [Helicocarpus griseus UAMH5409]
MAVNSLRQQLLAGETRQTRQDRNIGYVEYLMGLVQIAGTAGASNTLGRTSPMARTRPIEKFAKASAQCSAQATAYGKCIFADYTAVRKDMCAKEFMKLKDCYLV